MCVMCGCECGPAWGSEYTGPGPGFGFWHARPAPFGTYPRYVGRGAQLRRLEERERDLEQEAADVADAIRRLKEEAAGS